MVGIYKCSEYDENKLDDVINKLFLEHGFDEMILKGMNVALKPNLVSKKKPGEAVTTHPLFIKAVAKKIISLGANVVLCDSFFSSYKENVLENYYTYNELKPLEEIGLKLNYDTSSEYVKIKGDLVSGCDIISPILNSDLVINLAKVKTHSLLNFSCATKNMFGILPGLRKTEMHSRFPKQIDFANAVIDISLAIKNQISIVDGILALEGNGPTAGTPRKLGVILASENQFELDYVANEIIGMDVKDSYIVAESIKRNLCDPTNIKVVGEKIENVKVTGFKFPDTIGKKTMGIGAGFAKHIKPYPIFNKDKCKLCKICIERCPRGALCVKNGKISLIKKKCIACFCCHEHCPYKAIDIKHVLNLSKE